MKFRFFNVIILIYLIGSPLFSQELNPFIKSNEPLNYRNHSFASSSYFLPHFTLKNNFWNTELTLVNTLDSAQNITIAAYSSGGNVIGSIHMHFTANSGIHQSINDIFPDIHNESGWLRITPDVESSVSGIMTFTYLPTGAKSSLPLVDSTSSELIYPLIENSEHFNSGLAVVNLSENYQEVYISASDHSGSIIEIQTRWLDPFEKIAIMTKDFFNADLPEKTIVTISGKENIAGFALSLSKSIDTIVSVPASAITNITTNRTQFIQSGSYDGEYWPTDSWKTCAPEHVGIDPDRLIKVYDYLSDSRLNSKGVVIIKDGYIVGEGYFNNFSQNSFHRSFSVAKSITSASMGIAIDKKYIDSVHQKASDFFPEWNNESTRKKRISLQHIMTMTSGLHWNEEEYSDDVSDDDVTHMLMSDNFLEYILNKPSVSEPGTAWNYSSGDSMLLSGVIQRATGTDLFEFTKNHVFDPIGIYDVLWDHDSAGNTVGGWGIHTSARSFAKFGYLFLKKGTWNGTQIVPESWVGESTKPSLPNIFYYGYQWWLPDAWYDVDDYTIPEKTFIAIGLYRQYIFVVPEHNLVVVRLGDDYGYDIPWHALEFLQLILDAIE